MTTTPSGPTEPFTPARPGSASPLVAPKSARPGTNTILMAAAVFVAVAGLAFAAGRLTAPVASAASRFGGNGTFAASGGFAGGAGGGGFRGLGGGGLTIQGTVTAIGNGTITLQTATGQSETIDTSSGTTYHAETPATADQVQVGTKVLVRTTISRPAGADGQVPGANGGSASGGTGGVQGGQAPSGVQGGVAGGFANRTLIASDVTIAGQ